MSEICDRIKELRLGKGMSQEALSKATGLSQSSIARWELGETEPRASDIKILAMFFGETTDYLLGMDDGFR